MQNQQGFLTISILNCLPQSGFLLLVKPTPISSSKQKQRGSRTENWIELDGG